MRRKPALHLLDGVRVFQGCEFLHLCGEFFLGAGVYRDRLLDKCHVDLYPSVVDLLVEMVFVPQEVRHGQSGEPLLYRHLGLHVLLVVRLEHGPLFRVMCGEVPCPVPVGTRRLAGDAEIADQRLAFRHFLLVQVQRGADALQRQRQSQIGSPYQGAVP